MATISEVARLAQVSTGTVSRYLNGASNLAPDTSTRIADAISQLRYVPNGAARALRSRRSNSIGLVLPDIGTAFWPTVVRAVEDAAHSRGYAVLLCSTDDDVARQDHYLRLLAVQNVDGVIIAAASAALDQISHLQNQNIPLVTLDRRIDGWAGDAVCADVAAGGYALADHLLRLGHSQIGVITGPATVSTACDRVLGYSAAMREAGHAGFEDLIYWGEFNARAGERLTHQLLEEHPDATAIIAANHTIARGALNAVAHRNLRVPQDVALVCFGDTSDTSIDFSLLTMVTQPVYELGANAAQLLFSRLAARGPLQPRSVVLPVSMVVRRSCGSLLAADGAPVNLPLADHAPMPSKLIRRSAQGDDTRSPTSAPAFGSADGQRLVAALAQRPVDRPPRLELRPPPCDVCEYILERPVHLEGDVPAPDDLMAVALRTGLDAIVCQLPTISSTAEPLLSDALDRIERSARAVQGTGVGLVPVISLELPHPSRDGLGLGLRRVAEVAAVLVAAAGNRFARALTAIVVEARTVTGDGSSADAPRRSDGALWLAPILDAAHQRGIPILYAGESGAPDLAALHAMGVTGVMLPKEACPDLDALVTQWRGRLALWGGLSEDLFGQSPNAIEQTVRALAARHSAGGLILGACPASRNPPSAPAFLALSRAIVAAAVEAA